MNMKQPSSLVLTLFSTLFSLTVGRVLTEVKRRSELNVKLANLTNRLFFVNYEKDLKFDE